ncbi:MAG: hypothetical protein HC882_08355 [Acidobacteria bacterium]|nr:hypothetical protein [Acidobacteriota bacterium]
MLPILENEEQWVHQAETRSTTDLAGAIASLEHLRASHQPSLVVLCALCSMHKRAGHSDRALEVAKEALPICFRTKQGFVAARILEDVDADAHALGFDREQLIALGGALAETAEWRVGFRALASWLMKEPDDTRVAQLLLRLVDRLLAHGYAQDEAWSIARFLSVVAADEEVRQAAEERAARVESKQTGVITQPTRTASPEARADPLPCEVEIEKAPGSTRGLRPSARVSRASMP